MAIIVSSRGSDVSSPHGAFDPRHTGRVGAAKWVGGNAWVALIVDIGGHAALGGITQGRAD